MRLEFIGRIVMVLFVAGAVDCAASAQVSAQDHYQRDGGGVLRASHVKTDLKHSRKKLRRLDEELDSPPSDDVDDGSSAEGESSSEDSTSLTSTGAVCSGGSCTGASCTCAGGCCQQGCDCGCQGGCTGSSCGGCGNCCGYSCGGVFAGTEVTYFSTRFTQDRFGFGESFVYPWQAGGRVWLGYEGCDCWGVVARYWRFNAAANGILLDFSDPQAETFNVVSGRQEMDAFALDFELTRRIRLGCDCDDCGWTLLASGGFRHAALATRGVFADAFADETIAGGSFQTVRRRIDASGLTFGLQGRKQISCNWAAFWGVRESVLWGSNTARFNAIGFDTDVGPFNDSFDDRSNDTLWITELQVGGEWTKKLACGYGTFFMRTAFEWQNWHPQHQGSFAVNLDPMGRGDLNLYGVSVAAGITR